jgi:sigma-B regulation protein RsbU (phosphoserine phosphatase)
MHLAPPTDSWVTRVVIIDDDYVSAVCMEALLKQEGFTPYKAMNGPEGRAMVKAHKPDLILLDIQMPGENGLETCAKLKADPATADIPVIFLTGTEELATKLDGFKIGAVDYITKPYQTAEVLARIQVHIRARRTMAMLASAQMAQLDALAKAQKAILPDPASMPEAQFETFYQPIHAAGGDFYEVLQAGDRIFDYVVADVAGHDADASLVTSALKVLLQQGRSTLLSPLETLRMVNSALVSSFPEHVYLTLAWIRLNRNRNTMTTILAGHPPVLHLGTGGLAPETCGAPGDVLGMFDTIELVEVQRPVLKGDRILLYTDGLIELPLPGGVSSRKAGILRLAEAARRSGRLSLGQMVEGVVAELVRAAPKVEDDLLLVGVEV